MIIHSAGMPRKIYGHSEAGFRNSARYGNMTFLKSCELWHIVW